FEPFVLVSPDFWICGLYIKAIHRHASPIKLTGIKRGPLMILQQTAGALTLILAGHGRKTP
ncbi:hypothetical protein, partial [uncultured Muribaculum sp.]|uniref:hypothetical protein n=1 Tax=uncultured Muribaculum sp. TaxID=1918613 RepID=UPI00272C5D84